MPISFKIKVGVPPQKAFDYVSDIANHGAWGNKAGHLDVQPVSGGPTQVGSTFRSTQKFVGKDASAELKVTQLSRPTTLQFEALQSGKKPVTYIHTFTFTPSDGGTLVTRSIDSKPANPIGIIFYPAIRSDAMKALRNLKATLESSK